MPYSKYCRESSLTTRLKRQESQQAKAQKRPRKVLGAAQGVQRRAVSRRAKCNCKSAKTVIEDWDVYTVYNYHTYTVHTHVLSSASGQQQHLIKLALAKVDLGYTLGPRLHSRLTHTVALALVGRHVRLSAADGCSHAHAEDGLYLVPLDVLMQTLASASISRMVQCHLSDLR